MSPTPRSRSRLDAPIDDHQVRCDEGGRVTHWGNAVARLTGCPTDDAVGQLLARLASEDEGWTSRVGRAISMGVDRPMQFDEWLWQRSGRRHFVSMRLTPSADGYTLAFRDLTKQRLRDSRAQALSAVSRAALDASSVDDLARRTLGGHVRDARLGGRRVFWQVDAAARRMRCRQVVTSSGLALNGSEGEVVDVSIDGGMGLGGSGLE